MMITTIFPISLRFLSGVLHGKHTFLALLAQQGWRNLGLHIVHRLGNTWFLSSDGHGMPRAME
jgi:hypothetical protein